MATRATTLGRRTLDFTREHLAAVVVVLLVGCGWTGYSLLQAKSTPVALAAVPTVIASATPTPSPTARVLVHVLGAVRSPGVVELPQGARVADAIEEAGGLTATADPGELNLAAVVVDGSQVVIGTRGKPRGEVRGEGAGAGAGSPGRSATVSLNTATLEQLDMLPGVGPVTAQKILDWRKVHGRFSSVTELQEVDGIGPKTYADLAPNVRV
jgi:competence protein ComEA